jgi:diadenosine tetraphosphate (Ap4A) HIT family hydrolase
MLRLLDSCPFCGVSSSRLWLETEDAVAFPDSDPIADGHMIVAPRKHLATIYLLCAEEQRTLWKLVSEVRSRLLTGLARHGFASL